MALNTRFAYTSLIESSVFEPNSMCESTELKMFKLLKTCKQSFPNVLVAVRLYLTLMSSNCTGERSFSKRKRIKNDLRSTMGQQRLSHLSLMSIEHEILSSLDLDETISDFAYKKARKMPMWIIINEVINIFSYLWTCLLTVSVIVF